MRYHSTWNVGASCLNRANSCRFCPEKYRFLYRIRGQNRRLVSEGSKTVRHSESVHQKNHVQAVDAEDPAGSVPRNSRCSTPLCGKKMRKMTLRHGPASRAGVFMIAKASAPVACVSQPAPARKQEGEIRRHVSGRGRPDAAWPLFVNKVIPRGSIPFTTSTCLSVSSCWV